MRGAGEGARAAREKVRKLARYGGQGLREVLETLLRERQGLCERGFVGRERRLDQVKQRVDMPFQSLVVVECVQWAGRRG